MQKTVNYKDLMKLGFKKHTAQIIIREAKIKLVEKGYSIYDNPRCGVVPAYIVKEILALEL